MLLPRNSAHELKDMMIDDKSTLIQVMACCLNSSPPSAAYMCQRTGSALVQIMACRLFGAKPLPEPMVAYCQLDSWVPISVKFELEFCHFHSRKCIWNCRLPKWWPFCPGRDELRQVPVTLTQCWQKQMAVSSACPKTIVATLSREKQTLGSYNSYNITVF